MQNAARLIDGMKGLTAMVVGDVMVDAYLWGKVDRISPEAPVPVVAVSSRSARLGGAANVALNLRALGATPVVLSAVGDDENAALLKRLFTDAGLTSEGLVTTKDRRTTVKTRVISGHQHIVRVDEEDDAPLADAHGQQLLEAARRLFAAKRPDVLVFEDYDKGALTPTTIGGLIALAKEHGVPTAVDPKKRNFFEYRGADLFKPNLKELREGLKIDLRNGDLAAVKAAVIQLEARLGNAVSLITLSEHGVHVHGSGEEHTLPAHKREISDVSGAGDTVIAVAALCLAQSAGLRDLAELSNLAGGLVCEHVGVVPIDRDQLLREAQRLAAAP
ncbi:MAG: D-glycero-beta-D-manno-heptose-7-phosphate kinase [Flavobacteriales bacterium]|nr:MAG: D-glycero-beta-D-manno-heptose-7-phosphate kinase [Flavobacteriales bacterium]